MKQLILRLILSIGCLLSSFHLRAYDFEDNGICYEITSFTDFTVAAVSLSSGSGRDINIPASVQFTGKDLKVTKLSKSFAANNDSITSVNIEAELDTLASRAFMNCQELTSIVLSSVKVIDNQAFYGNNKLISIHLPNTLEKIEENVFGSCTNLETLIFPESLNSIGSNSFENCSKLNNIDLGNITSISSALFKNCSQLSNVKFSININRIESEAFSGTAIESFEVPNNVNFLGNEVFRNCKNLSYVSIGNGVTYLPQCFTDCPNLEYLRIEDGDETITFDRGTKIVATLPNSNYMYNGFFPSSIKRVYVGRQYKNYDKGHYGSGPFLKCEQLEEVVLGKNLIELPKIVISYYMQSSVCGAFQDCSNLSSLTLSPNTISISQECFKNCESLESIFIPHKVSSIPKECFMNCKNLSTISLGYRVANVSDSAFKGCDSLKNIIFYSPLPPTYEGNFSNSEYLNLKLIVPAGAKEIYQKTTPWSNFWNIEEDSDLLAVFEVNNVEYELTSDSTVQVSKVRLSELTDLIIPQTANFAERIFSVVGIDKDVFKGNQYLQSIELPEGISNILAEQFMNCPNLVNVKLPESILSLGSSVFYNCKLLSNLYIPTNLQYIGEKCFGNCSSLKSLDMANSKLSNIPIQAFENCSQLIDLKLPLTPYTISERAFYSCHELSKIELNKVITIDNEAFYLCKSLKSIVIPSSCMAIGNDVFKYNHSLRNVIFESSDSDLTLGYDTDIYISNNITPYPNPSTVDEKRTGFRNGYYNGLFYTCPIEHLVIDRNITLSKYYERKLGEADKYYDTIYNDYIYYSPFYGLKNLKCIEIGENVTSICTDYIDAFLNAKPTNIKYINFGDCNSVNVVVSNNNIAPIGGSFTQNVYESATLFLPNGGLNSYRTNEEWKQFYNIQESIFIPVTSISFETEDITMEPNDSLTLKPIIEPTDVSIKKLNWSSSNYDIKVSAEGIITSNEHSNGEKAIITATAIDGSEVSASITVNVIKGSRVNEVNENSAPSISIENGVLKILNNSEGRVINIYNAQGQLILSSSNTIIEQKGNGLYIIETKDYSKKIVL